MMVESMMFNSLFLMQKNVLVYYKHQNGQLQLVVHLLRTRIKELLLAIQSLQMHLVHHIIVICFMLHQEFSQGGNDSDARAYYDIGSQQRQEQFTFPISFKSKPLYVHPYAINKVELRHLSRIGISDSQITSTGFTAGISENSNVIEQIKMRYIAVGV